MQPVRGAADIPKVTHHWETQRMEAFIGTIIGWGPTWAPKGWALCHGQLLSIMEYDAVFSLLGTMYGGDGHTTFGLPDLRGRAAIGAGQGPGTSNYFQGQRVGHEGVTLDIAHMPSHNHAVSTDHLAASFPASSSDGTSDVPGPTLVPAKMVTEGSRGPLPTKGYNGATDTIMSDGVITGDVVLGHTGGNQSFDIVQPVQAIQYIICLSGIYPPRQ